MSTTLTIVLSNIVKSCANNITTCLFKLGACAKFCNVSKLFHSLVCQGPLLLVMSLHIYYLWAPMFEHPELSPFFKNAARVEVSI